MSGAMQWPATHRGNLEQMAVWLGMRTFLDSCELQHSRRWPH